MKPELKSATKRIKVFLRFPPGRAGRPVTYHLVKDFDLKINILRAEVSVNKGELVLDIEGRSEDIEGAARFCGEEGVEFHTIDNAVEWNRDRCVHCGACTAVCPSGALSLDRRDWSLVFSAADCYACNVCLKACPVRALSPGFDGDPIAATD